MLNQTMRKVIKDNSPTTGLEHNTIHVSGLCATTLARPCKLCIIIYLWFPRMAIPLVWRLYKTQVKLQKTQIPKLSESAAGTQNLPYSATFQTPEVPVFHVEVTLLMHEEEE